MLGGNDLSQTKDNGYQFKQLIQFIKYMLGTIEFRLHSPNSTNGLHRCNAQTPNIQRNLSPNGRQSYFPYDKYLDP